MNAETLALACVIAGHEHIQPAARPGFAGERGSRTSEQA
jgi:hypothetical protein